MIFRFAILKNKFQSRKNREPKQLRVKSTRLISDEPKKEVWWGADQWIFVEPKGEKPGSPAKYSKV